MRYLPVVVLLALTIYALVDCVRHDDSDMPVGLPKALWVVLIVLFPAIGPIAWLVVSRVAREAGSRRRGLPTRPRPGAAARRPAGPVAPDDDPDFLAALDRQRREREREARRGKTGPAPQPGAEEATGGAAGEQPRASEQRPDGDADTGPAPTTG